MHEMAILSNVMDMVLDYAGQNDATEVEEVSLVVGEMRDVVDELMESCFRFLARDTIAANARLVMTKVPLRAQCNDCLLVFPVSVDPGTELACPECGSRNLSVKTGREFYISSITVR